MPQTAALPDDLIMPASGPVTEPSALPGDLIAPAAQPRPTMPGIPYMDETMVAAEVTGTPLDVMMAARAVENPKNDPKIRSDAGAIGLMQIMPATGRELGYSVKDLEDPEKNLEAGGKYLKQNHEKFGSWSKAYQAFHDGPGNAETGIQGPRGKAALGKFMANYSPHDFEGVQFPEEAPPDLIQPEPAPVAAPVTPIQSAAPPADLIAPAPADPIGGADALGGDMFTITPEEEAANRTAGMATLKDVPAALGRGALQAGVELGSMLKDISGNTDPELQGSIERNREFYQRLMKEAADKGVVGAGEGSIGVSDITSFVGPMGAVDKVLKGWKLGDKGLKLLGYGKKIPALKETRKLWRAVKNMEKFGAPARRVVAMTLVSTLNNDPESANLMNWLAENDPEDTVLKSYLVGMSAKPGSPEETEAEANSRRNWNRLKRMPEWAAMAVAFETGLAGIRGIIRSGRPKMAPEAAAAGEQPTAGLGGEPPAQPPQIGPPRVRGKPPSPSSPEPIITEPALPLTKDMEVLKLTEDMKVAETVEAEPALTPEVVQAGTEQRIADITQKDLDTGYVAPIEQPGFSDMTDAQLKAVDRKALEDHEWNKYAAELNRRKEGRPIVEFERGQVDEASSQPEEIFEPSEQGEVGQKPIEGEPGEREDRPADFESETTPAGEQTVVPGAEVSAADRLADQAGQPLTGGSRDAGEIKGGLFEKADREDRAAGDLFKEKKKDDGTILSSGLAGTYHQIKNYQDKLWSAINKKIFTKYEPLGSLNDQPRYLTERYLTLGKVGNVEKIAGQIEKVFYKASQADKDASFRYLTTRGMDPKIIKNPVIRKAAVKSKKMFYDLGKNLVHRGLISEESFEELGGRYLPGIYLKYLLKEGTHGGGAGGPIPGRMGYRFHKDETIPQDVKDLILGEITDPGFLVSRGIVQEARDIAIIDFLNEISKHEDWVYPDQMIEFEGRKVTRHYLEAEASRLRKMAREPLMKPRQNEVLDKAGAMEEAAAAPVEKEAAKGLARVDLPPIENYRQIPDSARYGQLRGLWVRKEIHNDVVGATNMVGGHVSVMENILGHGRLATKFNRVWKLSKVALNPPTQIRNYVSNGILLHISGVPLLRAASLMTVESPREILKNGKYYRIFKKYGGTQTTFSHSEMARIKRDLLRNQEGGFFNALRDGGAQIAGAATDVYGAMETVGKVARIKYGMENMGETEEEAVIAAQQALFDYSLVPAGVQYARNAPVGIPFITFYYKVLPRIVEAAIKRPGVFLPYIAIPAAISAYIASEYDVTDEDLEKLQNTLPEAMREKRSLYLMPNKDANGNWQWTDFGYLLPWNVWIEGAEKALKGDIFGVLKTFGVFGAPLAQVIAITQTGIDPFTGREIANKNDPGAKRLSDILTYAWRFAMPSFLSNTGAAGKTLDLINGKIDRYDRPPMTGLQVLGRLLGFNVYPIDPEKSRDANLYHMQREIQAVKRRASYVLKDPNMSEEQYEKELDTRLEMLSELEKRYEAYIDSSEIHPNLLRKSR